LIQLTQIGILVPPPVGPAYPSPAAWRFTGPSGFIQMPSSHRDIFIPEDRILAVAPGPEGTQVVVEGWAASQTLVVTESPDQIARLVHRARNPV
jgi:hypothetical protein